MGSKRTLGPLTWALPKCDEWGTMSGERRKMMPGLPCQREECERCGECPQQDPPGTGDAPKRDPEGTEPRGLPYLFDRRKMPQVDLNDPFHSQR